MKKQRRQSLDGFVLSGSRSADAPRLDMSKPKVPGQFLRRPEKGTRQALRPDTLPRPQTESTHETEAPTLSRSEISESLSVYDDESPSKKRKRRFGLHWPPKFTKKRVAIISGVLALLLIGFVAYKILANTSQLFSGNIFDLLGSGAKLKTDVNGRTNILVFGTSEDDPAHKDSGANLTDSIMVISLDQEKKNAVMVSVPRDLWVKYGQACISGYEGKINVVYECASEQGSNEPAGARKLMGTVGDAFGLQIQYYAHVNYTVVRDTVNAVGGVTVNIDSDDPRGILDRNFDWKCRYQCYYVKWPNGPAKLNGEQALALARARNAAGGYGLSGGNFDREQYQQKIIIALKDKAGSIGTLANPVKVTSILDALGKNVRTNFSAAEVKTLINLAGEIPSSSIKRVSLVEEGKAVLTTGNIGGQSVVIPVAGTYEFGEVQKYIAGKLNPDSVESESPSIVVLNGSDKSGMAGKKATEIKTAGFSDVTTGDTATKSSYGSFVWYDLSGGNKPNSLNKLKTVLGKDPSGVRLPNGVQADADFVIIVGNGAN